MVFITQLVISLIVKITLTAILMINIVEFQNLHPIYPSLGIIMYVSVPRLVKSRGLRREPFSGMLDSCWSGMQGWGHLKMAFAFALSLHLHLQISMKLKRRKNLSRKCKCE